MSIHPTFRYDDPRAAIDFLVGSLGFRELHAHTDDVGAIVHAELAWDHGDDTGVLAVGPRTGAGRFDTGRNVTYLTCDDPDSLCERAVTYGADVVMEIHDQDYGSREFAIRDAEGNVWSLGTYRMGG